MGMNAVFASGIQTYAAAGMQLSRAADRANPLRVSTIPKAPPTGAETPGAPVRPADDPTTSSSGGGRATSSKDDAQGDFVGASIDMIEAEQKAKLASTSIRAADEMSATLLDMTA